MASPDVAKPSIGLEPGAEFLLPVSVAAAALGGAGGERGGVGGKQGPWPHSILRRQEEKLKPRQ